MDEFKQVVLKLVRGANMTHKQLSDALRQILTEESANVPKIGVLHNADYGGFGFSDVFEAYCIDHDVSYKNRRVECVQHLVPFAQYCLGKYPLIARCLRLYYGSPIDLQSITTTIETLAGKLRMQKHLNKQTNWIESQSSSVFGDETVPTNTDEYNLLYLKPFHMTDCFSATKECLLGMMNDKMVTIKKEIEQHHNELISMGCTESMRIKMLELLKQCDLYVKGKSIQNIRCSAFADHIEEKGQNHMENWLAQPFYKHLTMIYLLKYGDDVTITNEMTHEQYLDIGLLFASGSYCRLAIEYIPEQVSWTIHEYDGQEDVRLL